MIQKLPLVGQSPFLMYVNYIADSQGCCWKTITDDFKI